MRQTPKLLGIASSLKRREEKSRRGKNVLTAHVVTCTCGPQVIAQYLLDKYSDIEPSFLLSTPEQRAKAASITRTLDLYIHSIQVCADM